MTTYYVAEAAAGTEDGSSYDNRMDVVDHNADTYSFVDGDVIYLCDTISSQVVIPASGSAGDGNRITYKGDLSGHAGGLTCWSSGGALRGEYRNYITVDGIEIRNGQIGIVFKSDCNYVTIKKCKIHDMSAANSKGIMVTTENTTTLRNSNFIIGGAPGDGNEIYNVGIDTGGGDIILAMVDEFLVSYNKCYGGETTTGIDGMSPNGCTNGIIEWNAFYDHNKAWSAEFPQSGEDGIDLKGSSNIHVRYNHIYGNRAGGILVNNSDWLTQDCSDIYIYNNLIHDNAISANIVISNLIENCYIFNNILYNSGSHGISANTDGTNIQIYNNTIINCHGDGSNHGIYVNYTNRIIKNNIIYSDTHNDLIRCGDQSANVTLDNNQYYYTGGAARVYWDGAYRTIPTLQSTYSQEANGQEGDPKLTNVVSNIFTLLSDSPCINQGANLGVDYDDALNPSATDFTTFPPTVNTLDQDDYGNWEIGAYVFTSAEPYGRFRGISRIKMPFNMNVGRRFI